MCGLYAKADAIVYESRTRSLRIHGVLTSIRMENSFWDMLTDVAAQEGLTTNQLIVTLHDELVERRNETTNFASFLRVCCLRYITLVARTGNGLSDAAPLRAVR